MTIVVNKSSKIARQLFAHSFLWNFARRSGDANVRIRHRVQKRILTGAADPRQPNDRRDDRDENDQQQEENTAMTKHRIVSGGQHHSRSVKGMGYICIL